MTEIADRYRRLADRFTHVVESVSDEEWANPSPCEEWSARDVLEHVVESEWGFLERFGFAPADTEPSWPLVRDTMQAVLEDPERAGTEYEGFFGPTTVAETVDGFFSFDLLVHAWDIARAVGLSEHEEMEEAEVERYLEMLRARGDAVRGPGVFGPPLEVDDSADLKTRFLAFTGRRS
jgi:uncharacterized protein (TIGR03086 family)